MEHIILPTFVDHIFVVLEQFVSVQHFEPKLKLLADIVMRFAIF